MKPHFSTFLQHFEKIICEIKIIDYLCIINKDTTIKTFYIMTTHNDFLSKMVDLEFAINHLEKFLDEECENERFSNENGDLDINRYMMARNIVSLAKSLTATKLAISSLHKIVYTEE